MATATALPPPKTLAELLERLGDVPLDRIRMQPPPGRRDSPGRAAHHRNGASL